MFVIRHQLFEKASNYAWPIVTHEFRGPTIGVAMSYFRAHLRYDRMLQSTTDEKYPMKVNAAMRGSFDGIEFRSLIRVAQEG